VSSPIDKRLVLVCGKGGVGRSTVAAALASAAARRGQRTLLYESNAKDRFARFFDAPTVLEVPTRMAPDLYALNTNPTAALHEYGLMVLRFERVYKMVFENRLTKYFLRAIPGLDDYSILGKAWWHTTEEKGDKPLWDSLIFDMPASGHAVSMLKIPRVILDAVPEGPLTRDAAKLWDLLRDPERTAIVLVTLAEEMPANEAREFTAILRDHLGLTVSHLVVNQVHPDRFPRSGAAARTLDALARAAPADGDLAALLAHAELGRDRRLLNEHYLAQFATELSMPQVELPYLFTETLGPGEIDHLSRLLDAKLG
jgi:anion-transporting  ArsA/GET3 family ATPase